MRMRRVVALWLLGVLVALSLLSIAKVALYISCSQLGSILYGEGRRVRVWVYARNVKRQELIEGEVEKAGFRFNDTWGFFDLEVVVRTESELNCRRSGFGLSPFELRRVEMIGE